MAKKKSRVVYLAAPFWDENPAVRTQRRRQAIEYGDRLFHRKGTLFYSPLLYSERYKEKKASEGYWIEHGLRMLEACDEIHVLTLPGWDDSEGVGAERQRAQELGLKEKLIEKFARVSFNGSRGITKEQIKPHFDDIIERFQVETVVTHGEASGACEAVRKLAQEYGLDLELHHLQRWRCAGAFHWRSLAVLEASERGIFFHDGKSQGTANEMELARKHGFPFEYYLLQKDGTFKKTEEETQHTLDFSILADVLEDDFEKKIPKQTRTSPEYKRFRQKCLDRDGYKCVMCQATEKLCVHHIVPFSKSDAHAVDVSNGQTLCENCHLSVHGKAPRK